MMYVEIALEKVDEAFWVLFLFVFPKNCGFLKKFTIFYYFLLLFCIDFMEKICYAKKRDRKFMGKR